MTNEATEMNEQNDQILDANQEPAPEVEQRDIETPESSEEGEQQQPKKDELSPEEQARVGRAIKAEREKLRRQAEADRQRMATELQQQQAQAQAPQGSVFDPETGDYVDANSAIGQIIVRNQKIAQRRQTQLMMKEYDDLSTKATEGYERFDDYADTNRTFVQLGTDPMAEALKGTDDPAAIIHHLGSHPEELKRIAQLPPARQQREIHLIENRLNPPKRLVSSASKPVSTLNESNNPAVRVQEQSIEQRIAHHRRKMNME